MKVYHSKKLLSPWDEIPSFKENYVLVAEVETEDLEEAYSLTNSFDKLWHFNEKVKVCLDAEVLAKLHESIENEEIIDYELRIYTRSTSVGDIMEVNGKYFSVAGLGFDEYDPENVKTVEVGDMIEVVVDKKNTVNVKIVEIREHVIEVEMPIPGFFHRVIFDNRKKEYRFIGEPFKK